ncbi:MAG: hypothetical protein WDO19_06860 [Bacteroidota bacterium]
MSPRFNKIQLELLKLFSYYKSEEDLKELKSLLIAYLSNKVVQEADKAFEEKNHTEKIFETWKAEHYRKTIQ